MHFNDIFIYLLFIFYFFLFNCRPTQEYFTHTMAANLIVGAGRGGVFRPSAFACTAWMIKEICCTALVTERSSCVPFHEWYKYSCSAMFVTDRRSCMATAE